jgi:hypothetical protein
MLRASFPLLTLLAFGLFAVSAVVSVALAFALPRVVRWEPQGGLWPPAAEHGPSGQVG